MNYRIEVKELKKFIYDQIICMKNMENDYNELNDYTSGLLMGYEEIYLKIHELESIKLHD